MDEIPMNLGCSKANAPTPPSVGLYRPIPGMAMENAVEMALSGIIDVARRAYDVNANKRNYVEHNMQCAAIRAAKIEAARHIFKAFGFEAPKL